MVYFQGFILGISLITALGPQNIFLIRQGALRNHALLSALICFFCDIILVTGSVMGLQHVLVYHASLRVGIRWFGVLFLTYYGINAIYSAIKSAITETDKQKNNKSHWQIISMALGFSLLNPHAIIDSLIIIGGGSSQFPNNHQAFLLGVITASFVWFTSLTLTTRYFSSTLSKAQVWRMIEGLSGVLMLYLAIKLALLTY